MHNAGNYVISLGKGVH